MVQTEAYLSKDSRAIDASKLSIVTLDQQGRNNLQIDQGELDL